MVKRRSRQREKRRGGPPGNLGVTSARGGWSPGPGTGLLSAAGRLRPEGFGSSKNSSGSGSSDGVAFLVELELF